MLAFLVGVSLLTSMIAVGPAQAGSKGRRNTTIALGALALHQALHHKTGNALVLGAGTAYAYKRYRDSRKSEKARRRLSYLRRHRSVSRR
jgi:hypothetical protein